MASEEPLADQDHKEARAVSAGAAAAAALLRASQAPAQKSAAQLSAEHDRRQTFRRMIDPGIVRPNSKEQASSSLKVKALSLAIHDF
jgi:hypothetical protein